jgi:hypothetical protein
LGSIYYDRGGSALGLKRPTNVAHWRCRPVIQNVEREKMAALVKKARYLNILNYFIQKEQFYQKIPAAKIFLNMFY